MSKLTVKGIKGTKREASLDIGDDDVYRAQHMVSCSHTLEVIPVVDQPTCVAVSHHTKGFHSSNTTLQSWTGLSLNTTIVKATRR